VGAGLAYIRLMAVLAVCDINSAAAAAVLLLLLLLLSYKEYNMNKQTTQCIENSAVRESYRTTVQSAEIISLISDN